MARDKTILSILEPLAWLGAILVIWEVVSRALNAAWFLPAPTAIVEEIFSNPSMFGNFSFTLYGVLAGFGMALLVGSVLGILISHSIHLDRGLFPLLSAFSATPKSAFAPLAIVWFGYGSFSSIFIVFLITFFPILMNTIAGMKAVEPDLLSLLRSLRATKFQIFTKIRLPRSLPYIFSGLKISAPISVVGAVVTEYISGYKGLGYLIRHAQLFLETTTVFAAIATISIIGLSMYFAIRILERRLLLRYRRSW